MMCLGFGNEMHDKNHVPAETSFRYYQKSLTTKYNKRIPIKVKIALNIFLKHSLIILKTLPSSMTPIYFVPKKIPLL